MNQTFFEAMWESYCYYQDCGVEMWQSIQSGDPSYRDDLAKMVAVNNSIEAVLFLFIPDLPVFPWAPK